MAEFDTEKTYTTKYDSFRGVDFTTDSSNVFKRRSPTAVNMFPDLAGNPHKRTGWEKVVTVENFGTRWSADNPKGYHLEGDSEAMPLADEIDNFNWHTVSGIYPKMIDIGNNKKVIIKPNVNTAYYVTTVVSRFRPLLVPLTYSLFHSKATLEAERRGLVINSDRYLCWADTGEEVEADEDGFFPYEEYHYMFENGGEMPPEITDEMKWEAGLVYDHNWGKAYHDARCDVDHTVATPPVFNFTIEVSLIERDTDKTVLRSTRLYREEKYNIPVSSAGSFLTPEINAINTEFEPDILFDTRYVDVQVSIISAYYGGVGKDIRVFLSDNQCEIKYGLAPTFKIYKMESFELGGEDVILMFTSYGVYSYIDDVLTLHMQGDFKYITHNFFYEGNGLACYFFRYDKEKPVQRFVCKKEYGAPYNRYTVETVSTALNRTEVYIPTILIGTSPDGVGQTYEPINLMTKWRSVLFTGTATDTKYVLPSRVDVSKVRITISGSRELVQGEDFTVTSDGVIRFAKTHQALANGQDNIRVNYAVPTRTPAMEAFYDADISMVFGSGLINTVFITSSDVTNYRSRVWYSYSNYPLYFPDTNYVEAGGNDTSVQGLCKVDEYLGIVKQGTSLDSTIYLAYPTTYDEETTYAIKSAVSGVGAESKYSFASLNGEALFLSNKGVMGIEPSTVDNAIQVKNRSYYVDGKLLDEAGLSEAKAYVWKGHYFLSLNNHTYILDGSQKLSWENSKTDLQYEAYYWINTPVNWWGDYHDSLWFSDRDGNLCKFKSEEEYGNEAYNDNGQAIVCEWSTVFDNDGATQYFKTMQKKGCIVTFEPLTKSSAKLSVKKDDNKERFIGEIEYTSPNTPFDFFIKKKIKKYKRLQIIIRNDKVNEPFGILEIVKVYVLTNYSKKKGVNMAEQVIYWDDIENKPETYPPTAHDHDARYDTKTEIRDWSYRTFPTYDVINNANFPRYARSILSFGSIPAGGSATATFDYSSGRFSEVPGISLQFNWSSISASVASNVTASLSNVTKDSATVTVRNNASSTSVTPSVNCLAVGSGEPLSAEV